MAQSQDLSRIAYLPSFARRLLRHPEQQDVEDLCATPPSTLSRTRSLLNSPARVDAASARAALS